MFVASVAALFVLGFPQFLVAQTVECATVVDGCDKGSRYDTTLRNAIAKFESDKIYGGSGDLVIFSTSLSGDTLAQISYSCRDGSAPPPLEGPSIRSQLGGVADCPNRCGSVGIASTNGNCGLGVLITENANRKSCWSRALDVFPVGKVLERPAEVPSSGSFRSIGCWTDDVNARTLDGGTAVDPAMTVEKCLQLGKGSKYVGLEYSTECFWGNKIASSSTPGHNGCSVACGGSSSQLCGGGNAINLYEDSEYKAPETPLGVNPGRGVFTYQGCYTDGEVRALPNHADSADMTVQKCLEIAAGARYAGLQNGNECWYGNTLSSSVAEGCSTPCAGNGSEVCGGGWRLTLYTNTAFGVPPTANPGTGAFKHIGCYTDSETRSLSNSVTATDMTLEKCIALAGDQRYIGLENGNECFWGKTLGGSQTSEGCSMACTGNNRELCGGGWRLNVYENGEWIDNDPVTAQEILDSLNDFLEIVTSMWELFELWDASLKTLGKRASRRSITQPPEVYRQGLRGYKRILDRQAPETRAVIARGFRQNKATSSHMNQFIDAERRGYIILQNLDQSGTAVTSESTTQEVAVATEVAVGVRNDFGSKVLKIGLFGIIISLAAGIFAHNLESPGTNPTTIVTTNVPTTTIQTSTTTTSTCTATATQSPVIIMMKQGTTKEEYYELVQSLPADSDNLEIVNSGFPHWFYVATIDECTYDELWKHPIVYGMSMDVPLEGQWGASSPSTSQESMRVKQQTQDHKNNTTTNSARVIRRKGKKRATFVGDEIDRKNFSEPLREPYNKEEELRRRGVPENGDRFRLLRSTDRRVTISQHGWLSQISRTRMEGKYYSFRDLVYNDRDDWAADGKYPIAYVIDGVTRWDHEDLRGKTMANWAIDDHGNIGAANPSATGDGDNHGTCMSSLIVGHYAGMARRSRLVTISLADDWPIGSDLPTHNRRLRMIVVALTSIVSHVSQNGMQGAAVVSMSVGWRASQLVWDEKRIIDPGRVMNVFDAMLPYLWKNGIAAVAASGNIENDPKYTAEQKELSYWGPTASGGRNSPLIVVGASTDLGLRAGFSQYRDLKNEGILSLYNLGVGVDCATPFVKKNMDLARFEGHEGTSPATALTAGMIAYYLQQATLRTKFNDNGLENVAMNIKNYLIDQFKSLKDSSFMEGNLPLAALGEFIPCKQVTDMSQPAVPDLTVTPPGYRSFEQLDLTNGANYLAPFNLRVECHDLIDFGG